MISNRNVINLAQEAAQMWGSFSRRLFVVLFTTLPCGRKIFSLFLPLTTGAVVHFGESIETVQQDLAEVSPSVFLGVPRIWEKMHAQVTLKMQDASWLKRTLYQFFISRCEAIADRRRNGSSGGLDGFVAWLGDILVFRALQERLGLRRCRLPVSGAAPISPELLRWFHGIGVAIGEGYGQTESTGVSHLNRPGAVRIGTVGQLIPGMECKIADDGEILLRGDAVFCGYLHNEEATRSTIDEEGWLHTGDIGSIDTDGYLSITGRKKEIIITAGGKNLSPKKLRTVLKTAPTSRRRSPLVMPESLSLHWFSLITMPSATGRQEKIFLIRRSVIWSRILRSKSLFRLRWKKAIPILPAWSRSGIQAF